MTLGRGLPGGGLLTSVILAPIVVEFLSAIVPLLDPATLAGIVNLAAPTGASAVDEIQRLRSDPHAYISNAAAALGAPFVEALIKFPLDIPEQAGDVNASGAFDTLRRAVGFGLGLEQTIGFASGAADIALGAHAPKGLFDSLRKLPDAIGMPFFIGTVLGNIFERAVGPSIEEIVNVTKHPQRLDLMTGRALLKERTMSPAQFAHLADLLGYDAATAELVSHLGEKNLGLGEVQAAVLMGLRDLSWARDYLRRIGMNDEDADIASAIYLLKAQTEGGQVYKAAARRAFSLSHISEPQFRQILAQVNTPQESIDLEVAAVTLDRKQQVAELSAGDIKQGYLHGVFNIDSATTRLVEHGYSVTDAHELIVIWDEERKPKSAAVSEQRVLQYMVGGVITKADAFDRLTSLGYRAEDARLLTDHPETMPSVWSYGFSEGTVISALAEGVIGTDAALALLHTLGVPLVEATLRVDIALARQHKERKPKAAHKEVSEGQVLEAVDLGLGSPAWAHRELVRLGYSDADAALLITERVSKMTGKVPEGWQVLN